MDDVDDADAHETEADDELGNGATKEDRRMIKQLKLRTEVMNMMMGNLETLTSIWTYPPSEVVAEMYSALEELEKIVNNQLKN
jgi:hypothetical protein